MPFYVYAAAAMLSGSMIFLVWAFAGERKVDHSNHSVAANLSRGGTPGDSRQLALSASARSRLLDPMFEAIARSARNFTGGSATTRTQRKLELAGLYDSGWTVERVLVIRVLAFAIGAVVAFASISGGATRNSMLVALISAAIGFLAPNAWLDRKVGERQGMIEQQLPDVIDQLTVSVEAGLGFDAAMAQSADGRGGPLADELKRVLQDLQVGVGRDEALLRMVDRTDVADLKQFVLAVRQSSKHGLPIGRILRVQSTELREKRRSRVEEKAGSLPVKIVFPLVFCILPSLFIVILGPAVMNIGDAF